MSALTQRLKQSLISYLEAVNPDEQISVSDAQDTDERGMPCLAVAVPNAESHSVPLAHVQRCTVEITLVSHAGDESLIDIDSVTDQLETALSDPSAIKNTITDGLAMDHWHFQGAEQTWEKTVVEVKFTAECLVRRV